MSAAEERAAFWQEMKHRMTRRLTGWDYRQLAIARTPDGERQIAREAMKRRLPLVALKNMGFAKLEKPVGRGDLLAAKIAAQCGCNLLLDCG